MEGVITDAFVRLTTPQRAFFISAYGAVVFVIAVLASRPSSQAPAAVVVLLAVFVGLRAAPLLVGRSDELGWFHPLVFGSIFAIVELIRRAPMYANGLASHRAIPWDPDALGSLIVRHLLFEVLALFCYYGGYIALRTRRRALIAPRETRLTKKRRLSERFGFVPLRSATIAMMALSVLVIMRSGGLGAAVSVPSQPRHLTLAGNYYWVMIAQLPSAFAWVRIAADPSVVRRPVFVLSSTLAFAAFFVASGSRGGLIYVALIATIIYMLRRRRSSIGKLLLGGAACLYAVGSLGGATPLDSGTVLSSSRVQTAITEAAAEFSTRVTDADGALPIYAFVPERDALLMGSSYVAVVALPVPRQLWPEKPSLIGSRTGRTFFGISAGVPPGGAGEAYWNFFVPGIIAVFLLYGAFHHALARYYSQSVDSIAAPVVLAIALIQFQDPSTTALVAVIRSLVCVGFVLLFVRVRQKSATARPEVNSCSPISS